MMRAFSSDPHRIFIANRQRGRVKSANPTRANHSMLLGGILLLGLLLGGLAAVVALPRPALTGGQPSASPTQSPMPSPTVSASLPAEDVPGDDLARLPRYPGSVRSDYEVALDDRYRLTVTEYLAHAGIGEVRAFYQGVITAHGWERADIGFTDGEWSYSLVGGETLALIEIEETNGLVEIDLQLSEPVAVPSSQPAPHPTVPPPPPPPAPPLDDDDDDD
jgi:hypothetical protein